MNCTKLRQVLDAYLDRELDHATTAEITEHMVRCPACTALREERRALKQRLRADAPYFAAPLALKRAVSRSLSATPSGMTRRASGPSWLQAGALVVFAALISALVSVWLTRPLSDDDLPAQVIASHVASLASERPLADIISTDRHVVKPWFQGKLDFAPVVRDLSAQGYALIGGRLDHVGSNKTAAIVYQVRKHLINVFVWRAADNTPRALDVLSLRGYGVATWSEGGLNFTAVSDVDPRELERFAKLIQEQP